MTQKATKDLKNAKKGQAKVDEFSIVLMISILFIFFMMFLFGMM